MEKHKRLVVGICGVVLLIIFAIALTIGKNLLISYRVRHDPRIVQLTKEPKFTTVSSKEPSSISDYSLIISQINAKKWDMVISTTVKYGDSPSNPTYQRISAYGYCVYVASILKNNDITASCTQKGQLLIASLPKEDQDFFTKTFEANTKNQTYKPTDTSRGKIDHV